MELHRVDIESSWRPDHAGIRHRRYLVRCLCGWSEGWFATSHEATGRYDEHRAAAAANAAMIRASAAGRESFSSLVGDHPAPLA
jgi:hypothetical protein